jgi:hypothetical protein
MTAKGPISLTEPGPVRELLPHLVRMNGGSYYVDVMVYEESELLTLRLEGVDDMERYEAEFTKAEAYALAAWIMKYADSIVEST